MKDGCFLAAEMELSDIRDMYFENKDDIFSGKMGLMNVVQNTNAMEKLAKKYFGERRRMDSVGHPKYEKHCLVIL